MIKTTLKTTNKEFICVDFTFAVLSIKLTKSSLLENDAKNVDTNRCNTTPILQCKVLSITFLPNTHPAFNCSKTTLETPGQCVKSGVTEVVLITLMLSLERFQTLFWGHHC